MCVTLTLTRCVIPALQTLVLDPPPISLTALCTLRVVVCVVVRHGADKRASMRQDVLQVPAVLGFKVFTYFQSGFIALLELTATAQF